MKIKNILHKSSDTYAIIRSANTNRDIERLNQYEAIKKYGERKATKYFHSPFNYSIIVVLV